MAWIGDSRRESRCDALLYLDTTPGRQGILVRFERLITALFARVNAL
jgi:hypothetical protein